MPLYTVFLGSYTSGRGPERQGNYMELFGITSTSEGIYRHASTLPTHPARAREAPIVCTTAITSTSPPLHGAERPSTRILARWGIWS